MSAPTAHLGIELQNYLVSAISRCSFNQSSSAFMGILLSSLLHQFSDGNWKFSQVKQGHFPNWVHKEFINPCPSLLWYKKKLQIVVHAIFNLKFLTFLSSIPLRKVGGVTGRGRDRTFPTDLSSLKTFHFLTLGQFEVHQI